MQKISMIPRKYVNLLLLISFLSGHLYGQAGDIVTIPSATGDIAKSMYPVGAGTDEVLWLSKGKRGSISGQMLYQDGSQGILRTIFPIKSKIGRRLSWQQMAGYLRPFDGMYTLFLHQPKSHDILRIELDMNEEVPVRSLKPVVTFSKREVYVGTTASDDLLVVVTIEKGSSLLHLYPFSRGKNYPRIDVDLRDETFKITNFGTLYSALVIKANPNLGYLAYSPNQHSPFHPPLIASGFPNKLYLDPERKEVIMAIDQSDTYSLVITMPFYGGQAKVHRLPAGFPPCQTRFGEYAPVSTYADGVLWQFQGCKKGVRLKRFDLSTDSVITEEGLLREEAMALESWADINSKTSGILGGLLKGAYSVDDSDPKDFFSALNQNLPSVSIIYRDAKTIEISLKVARQDQAAVALTGIAGATMLMGTGLGFFPTADAFTSIFTYNRSFDRQTLSSLPLNYTDERKAEAAQEIIRRIKPSEGALGFWAMRSYLWVGFATFDPRGYYLRRYPLAD